MQITSLNYLADKVVFINLDITCWSGKKTLTAEDLGINRQALPPQTLVSLGDKQLIDPVELRAFSTIRNAARRHCLSVGTRFMSGYIVPAHKTKSLLDELTRLEKAFDAKRTAFLAKFDQLIADWTRQQPQEWQTMIQASLVPAMYVGNRLSYSVQAVQIGKPSVDVGGHGGADNAVSGLSGQLCHEINQIAKTTLEQSFAGKTTATRRILNPFKSLRDKVEGLAFIDSRLRGLVEEIDQMMSSMPSQGSIQELAMERLRIFLEKVSKPEMLSNYQVSENISSLEKTSDSDEADVVLTDDQSMDEIAPQGGNIPLSLFQDNDISNGINDKSLEIATDEAVCETDSDDWYF